MLFFVLNIFISIITEAFYKVRLESRENPNSGLDLWTHTKQKLRNLLRKGVTSKKPKYLDHLGMFPKRIDELTNYVIRVSF